MVKTSHAQGNISAEARACVRFRDRPLFCIFSYSNANIVTTLRNMAHTLLVELDASTTLERQILQSGVESHGNDDLERQRYGLLRTACQDGDVFFIVLHQLFCCWSFDRPFVRKYYPAQSKTCLPPVEALSRKETRMFCRQCAS